MGKRGFPREDEEESESEDVGRRRREKRPMENVELAESLAMGRDQKRAEVNENDNVYARPVGSAVRISRKGATMIKFYPSFEFDGRIYELEDSVLLTPSDICVKPMVAVIKEIKQISSGDVMIKVHRFYRPNEAREIGCVNWFTLGSRELFYSFDSNKTVAESVMHKCIVHFLPFHKRIPDRTKHPGFIVRKVYNTIEKKLWKITENCFSDANQEEINRLMKKTEEHLRESPSPDNGSKAKISIVNQTTISTRSDGQTKDYFIILKEFQVCTGDTYRDKWLEKLLREIHDSCQSDYTQIKDAVPMDGNDKMTSNEREHIIWPDDAVRTVVALEKAVHEFLCTDFSKYNQKMRQFHFNIKHNAQLAKRLLKKELDPSMLLSMSPTELKEGLLANEKKSQKPGSSRPLKVVDARCIRCSKKRTAVINIFNAGESDERCQLKCTVCGQTWSAPKSVGATSNTATELQE